MASRGKKGSGGRPKGEGMAQALHAVRFAVWLVLECLFMIFLSVPFVTPLAPT